MYESAPPPTSSDAVPVLPERVAVTVCAPVWTAVHVAPVHEPLGVIEKVLVPVTSPRELSYRSRASAVYDCCPPDAIVEVAGERARWSSAPAVTPSEPVDVAVPSCPETVCPPACVAVQTFPLQVPSGPIENAVADVTSPRELPDESKPSAV